MVNIFKNPVQATKKLLQEIGVWGRAIDRTVFQIPPAENPDPIDSERYFKISMNHIIKSGLEFRDISRLFVSAGGLKPNKTGAYFPPQLIYTSPDYYDEEQFTALATQYDEQFDGGFQSILRSLQQPAMQYGRSIGEISWQKGEGNNFFADFIWSRDPEEFIFNPPNLKPGIYRKNHTYSSALSGDITRMPDGKFLHIPYDSLFNNPYGTSILRTLAKPTERWDSLNDAWDAGLKKAGFGSWVGEYGPDYKGDSDYATKGRALFLSEVQKLANGTASIFDEQNKIRNEKLQLEAQAFLDKHKTYVEGVSIRLTGSATALSEGKYGSYASKESTDVREKSDIEQREAGLMGAVFTYQFNRWFLSFNFANVEAVPQLQLIPPELIMPTTPEGQKTQDEDEGEIIDIQTKDEEQREDEEINEDEDAAEFQEGEAPAEEKAPVGYDLFPSSEPEPPIYFDVTDEARRYLDDLPVKTYADVTPDDAANVFTVKSLRNRPDQIAFLTALKDAIADTLTLKTEDEAWKAYIAAARNIFASLNLPMTGGVEADLIISFRQARQSAYQAGIDALMAERADDLYGIRFQTREDPRVRTIHSLWNGIVLVPDDPRVEKTKTPADFGCRCNQIPVFQEEAATWPLTPESEIPIEFPGESYKRYARGEE